MANSVPSAILVRDQRKVITQVRSLEACGQRRGGVDGGKSCSLSGLQWLVQELGLQSESVDLAAMLELKTLQSTTFTVNIITDSISVPAWHHPPAACRLGRCAG